MKNVLADIQQNMFEKNISEEEYQRREKIFLQKYKELRLKEENSFASKLSVRSRRFLHPIILNVYRTKNKLSGFKLEILDDKRKKTDRPVIFVPTHIGKFDVEVVSEAIRSDYSLLSGDYEHLQGTIDAAFLAYNGVIYFNEKDKEDRKDVCERMVKHLKDNGNLMFFIEGTWNMTPSSPMLPCYWGIVDIAKKSNAIIVPIAIEQKDKNFKVNIGENFDFNNYGSGNIERTRAIGDLRDCLATLKWQIWESNGEFSRESIDKNEWESYKKDRYAEWPYFDDEYVDSMTYKPKGVVDQEEVFAPVKKLVLKSDNAFLAKNR